MCFAIKLLAEDTGPVAIQVDEATEPVFSNVVGAIAECQWASERGHGLLIASVLIASIVIAIAMLVIAISSIVIAIAVFVSVIASIVIAPGAWPGSLAPGTGH